MSATLSPFFAAFPAKRLAMASGAHPKTAQRWRDGTASPSGDALIKMMTDDELFAAILRAAGRADHATRMEAADRLARALKAFGA